MGTPPGSEDPAPHNAVRTPVSSANFPEGDDATASYDRPYPGGWTIGNPWAPASVVEATFRFLLIARHSMSDIDTRALPLLPLTSGVVLPQMVVPLALESDEAQAAADAAAPTDGFLVLVPRIEVEGQPARYARVGTVAKIEEAGRLPNGVRGVLVRGLHRAVLGVGAPSPTPGLWVSV